MTDHWLPLRRGVTAPERVLLAAAHAGASANAIRPLGRLVPEDWQVLVLVLPGRDTKAGQPAGWSYADLVAGAAAALPQALHTAGGQDADLVAVGQCSGAWLLYGVLAAQAALEERCAALVTLSQAPWHVPRRDESLPEDSAELWRVLVERGDTSAGLAADPELRDLVEPIVRADFAALAGFPTAAGPLRCPIVAAGGRDDPRAAELELDGWSAYTSRAGVAWLPAGHLPLAECPAEVLELVAHPMAAAA